MRDDAVVVPHLRENGPSAADDIPVHQDSIMKPHNRARGVTSFDISANTQMGGSRMGVGRTKKVYYLFERHGPVEVVQSWLESNPNVLTDSDTLFSLSHYIGNFGSSWRGSLRGALEEMGREDLLPVRKHNPRE